VQTCKHAHEHENLTYQAHRTHKRKCQKIDQIPYKQAMDNIMYTMITTRLNITTIVSVVGQFIQDLGLCNIGEWEKDLEVFARNEISFPSIHGN
jgi:hypothetical protein